MTVENSYPVSISQGRQVTDKIKGHLSLGGIWDSLSRGPTHWWSVASQVLTATSPMRSRNDSRPAIHESLLRKDKFWTGKITPEDMGITLSRQDITLGDLFLGQVVLIELPERRLYPYTGFGERHLRTGIGDDTIIALFSELTYPQRRLYIGGPTIKPSLMGKYNNGAWVPQENLHKISLELPPFLINKGGIGLDAAFAPTLYSAGEVGSKSFRNNSQIVFGTSLFFKVQGGEYTDVECLYHAVQLCCLQEYTSSPNTYFGFLAQSSSGKLCYWTVYTKPQLINHAANTLYDATYEHPVWNILASLDNPVVPFMVFLIYKAISSYSLTLGESLRVVALEEADYGKPRFGTSSEVSPSYNQVFFVADI
jgi:hypothetical protein